MDSTHLQVEVCLLLDQEQDGEDFNKEESVTLEWAEEEEGATKEGEAEGMDLQEDKVRIKEEEHQVSKVSAIRIQVTVREVEGRREGTVMVQEGEGMEVGKTRERDIRTYRCFSYFKMYSSFSSESLSVSRANRGPRVRSDDR